ncbi:S41 family peptidase [uncultured Sphingomonas sp.]|uniref:S41 family peptidase n=1 Tax=uncultured Sphingomonas sp. TaxID=158754 RepID=UPI0025D20616|nr:S41 family peptidase [uncultured Sphingomonas sp.]
MIRFGRLGTILALSATLAGCGGGDGGSITSGSTGGGGSSPSGTTTSACSLRSRQNWVAAQMNEWYLFPDTLPNALDPSPYTTVSDYIDALTATARAQRKDRYFTYITSIAEENAYYNSGASAGFGFRLTTDSTQTKLQIAESFESGSALAAGVDRGTTILGIGTTASNIQTIQAIVSADPNNGLSNALGPDTAGTVRYFSVSDPSGNVRTVSLTKSTYTLQPVSPNYGAQIISDNGQRYGYINLRTFISTADPQLRAAFSTFKQQGITQVIVDLRYNGGGAISIADLFNNLLGGARQTSDVMGYTSFRESKAANNTTTYFAPQAESITPTRIAFIGTGGTASASELVLNRTLPYMGSNTGLIGANTYGKPVGQIALDNAQCDDRLRVIAISLQNANRQGGYYNGLASVVPASCQAGDDLTRKMGDPQEASTRAALNFLQGKSCTPISASASAQSADAAPRKLLQPLAPSAAQRDVPGMF